MSTIWLEISSQDITAVADALLWVFQRDGVSWTDHYLDDFINGSTGESRMPGQQGQDVSTVQASGNPHGSREVHRPSSTYGFLGF